MRSPRPESQPLNLRRLLNDPPSEEHNGRPDGRPDGRMERRNGGGLAPVRSLYPAPLNKSQVSPPVIPIQARPVLPSLRPAATPRPRRRRASPPSPLLYITRLLIFGVGVGAIVGTVLSIWEPPSAPLGTTPGALDGAAVAVAAGEGDRPFRLDAAPPAQVPAPFAARLGQPLNGLAEMVQPLVAAAPDLTTGVFVVDLDSGNYLDLNGATALPAASTIKVPILVALLQDVDANQASLNEALTMEAGDIGGEAGEIQYLPVGTQFSTMEIMTKMITISDNTATNMIVRRIGGAAAATQRFQAWGMPNTVYRNLLPDVAGTNVTSARDLSLLLTAVAQGDLLSLRSRDRFLEVMQGTITNTLIPAGSGADAVIAHKTGTIGLMVGDTGIIDMPNGKRYVITVLVQRPADDPRAQDLIREISRVTYQYFSRPASDQNPQTSLPAG